MMDRQKGQYVLECNGCSDTLETNKGSFHDALAVMRSENWRSVPPRKGHDDWSHYCPTCKVPQ